MILEVLTIIQDGLILGPDIIIYNGIGDIPINSIEKAGLNNYYIFDHDNIVFVDLLYSEKNDVVSYCQMAVRLGRHVKNPLINCIGVKNIESLYVD